MQMVAVSGPIPLALKLGEILAMKGKRVQVYCGREGLERQFSRPVAAAIRRDAHVGLKEDRVSLVDESVDSILGVERAEAIVSSGTVRTCDAVVVIPRSVPVVPVIDCQRGRNGGLLVDTSMLTSLPGVFAAGDSAEIRFKSGSVPARLCSAGRMGGEVAGTNAAGGNAVATPSWAVEQTYFGLEFCSAGLSEEEASAMGLDVAAEAESVRVPVHKSKERRETLVSMVYDRSTHQVYGLQIAGWRASSLSSASSLIVSLGLTVEQAHPRRVPLLAGPQSRSFSNSLNSRKNPQGRGSLTMAKRRVFGLRHHGRCHSRPLRRVRGGLRSQNHEGGPARQGRELRSPRHPEQDEGGRRSDSPGDPARRSSRGQEAGSTTSTCGPRTRGASRS